MSAILRTFTGRRLDLSQPRVEDIHIFDIALGLSHLCRFAGQLSEMYSVAQHSVLVARLMDPPHQALGLMHDASEAYMGDLSRNLKHHPLLAGYRLLEAGVQHTVYQAFQIAHDDPTGALHRHLKAADDVAAVFEKVQLRTRTPWRGAADIYDAIDSRYVSSRAEDMGRLLYRLPMDLQPLEPVPAQREFLKAFDREVFYHCLATSTRP